MDGDLARVFTFVTILFFALGVRRKKIKHVDSKKKKKKKCLEKEMAAHSSILAWKSPWTEEPGGLQSMGLYD